MVGHADFEEQLCKVVPGDTVVGFGEVMEKYVILVVVLKGAIEFLIEEEYRFIDVRVSREGFLGRVNQVLDGGGDYEAYHVGH